MSEGREQGELAEELKRLGQQLGAAAKTLWESEESKKFQQELQEGLSQFGHEINKAVGQARDSEQGRELEEQFRRTVRAAKETDFPDEARQALLKSLRAVNQQLDQFIASMESREGSGKPEGEGG